MKRFSIFSIFLIVNIISGQNPPIKKTSKQKDTTSFFFKKGNKTQQSKLTIANYLIISKQNDTTFVDTTLTIKKDYKFNYLRKNNFNFIQFANTGQTYNTLSIDNSTNNIMPGFAAQARHFNYLETNDIDYYRVPTPLTELYYKTVFSQGQNLDAFFTVNISPQLNFSIAYKGLRSLGNYQNSLTSTGNFRFTTNYQSDNKKYNMRSHIVMQDLFNQENGGLTDEDVIRFKEGDEEIQDRSVFDPNFENADSVLEGKRFYIDQSYAILSKKDSTSVNNLFFVNTISFQNRFFEYNQTTSANNFFGSSFSNTIQDKVTLEEFYSDLGLNYSNKLLGEIAFKVNYNSINYGYNSLVFLNNQTITNRIKEEFFGFEVAYNNQIGKLKLEGKLGANFSDNIKGNFLDFKGKYQLLDNIDLFAGINVNNRLPNYNKLLYQSNYTNYNWDNREIFKTIETQQLSFGLNSEKYININFDITNIENYAFFKLESIQNDIKVIKPIQNDKAIQYLRVKIQKEFRLGKFALDNTIMYQNVKSDENVINIPSLISRNTFYFSDEVFKKALKFQTGITFNFFSEYYGNGYDPLLAEFYTQNQTKIGGFPRLDFFVNAKIRQTRIFLKAEHFNSSFSGNNYFAAPNYPYRDFTIRFGLVWNFFL
ncbi:putative porin [Winogradskyella litorisediminis]|uniref:Porin n=1 Tax=Winogradskyella litorisediminis TaxID=1156618 RepID=A0ABW3N699_9FLAO